MTNEYADLIPAEGRCPEPRREVEGQRLRESRDPEVMARTPRDRPRSREALRPHRLREPGRPRHINFIDAYIPSAKVLVEQKSLGKDLRAKVKQSDGTLLTPFQQAKRYIIELPNHLHPKWVVISNFAEFHIYDMDRPRASRRSSS